MKILFVSERFPYPLDNGGNVRSYHLLRGLASEHKVVLVSEVPDQDIDQAAVRQLCEAVHTVPQRRRGVVREAFTLFRSLFRNSAFLLDRHYSRSLHALVSDLDRREGFDAIHLNHLDAALTLPHRDGKRHIVLDEHNIVSNQAITTLRGEKRLAMRVLLRQEIVKLQRAESQLACASSRVLVCSEVDRLHLRKLCSSADAVVIPNGVDLDYFSPLDKSSKERDTILFIGSMDYEPCDRAMRYFCSEVLPLIWRRRPNVKLIVVGRNPSPSLRALTSHEPRIELTGRVPDVRQVAKRAAAFIVPLLSGSGTRLKILEAMAMGLPIVTTTIGLEGIDATHERHCLVADDAATFCDSTIRLLDEASLANSLSLAARMYVESHYGWDAIIQKLLGVYRVLESS